MLIVYILKSSEDRRGNLSPPLVKMAKLLQLTLHLTVGLGHLPRQPTVSRSRDGRHPVH